MALPDEKGHRAYDEWFFGPFRLLVSERLLERDGTHVPLGARALEILIFLVERPGEPVTKTDLIARAWPDATVSEGSLRFQINALRKVLGDGQSGARYIITLPGRGYCFVAPVSRSSGTESLGGAASLVPEPSHRMPTRLTRTVGRDDAIQAISAQLATKRFVTIVGPGGIGKTTVAVAVGHLMLADFKDAVRFLDLGPLNDPHFVPSVVASTLGLLVQSDDPTSGLITFLRNKRMLLILDSCEHVIGSVAALAERIFREAPQVHILATSRETLCVEGEHVQRLAPLESPPDSASLTAAQVLAFPAAQLFVERVTASGHPFELLDRDAPVVGEICRRLDGIALAIELAAGRVNAYGIQGTAVLLNDRFRLLWEGRRTAPLRHQTLSATLDWSYDLLSKSEQVIFRRLSVFVGNFTLEAARSVATGTDVYDEQIITTIAGLVAKSLVTADTSGALTRYRLLDTTRTYVFGKLLDSGDADETARRHANYYVQFLEAADASSPLGSGADSFACLAEHLGNVRAALVWSFFECGDIQVGTALAATSARLFLETSLLAECYRWTERALGSLDGTTLGTRREMKLQAALGLALMFTKGNSDKVCRALNRGLALAEDLGDLPTQLRILGLLHIFHIRIGSFRSALAFALRDKVVATEIAHPVGTAQAQSALGISRHLEGSNASARAHLEAALSRVTGSQRVNTFHFGFDYRNCAGGALARTLWLQGHPDRAVMVAQKTVEEAETLGHPVTLCIALILSVSVVLWNGDLARAEQYTDRLIEQADRHSLAPYQAVGQGVRGELLVRLGSVELGLVLLRESLETLRVLRYAVLTTAFNSATAEGFAMTGKLNEALQTIDESIALTERNGDLFMMPELLRIKADILARMPQVHLAQAEEYFLKSLQLAASQAALAWELRTTTSLARFWLRQGRIHGARDKLALVIDRFSEGFESADLKAARLLLSELVQSADHTPHKTLSRVSRI